MVEVGCSAAERLLVVAHGTASPAGSATTAAVVAAIAAARPSTSVQLCFLDVVAPRLADVLDERPTIVVPLLLSTGYHVRSDIPAVTAQHPNVRVARHLGPHRLLADAVADRLCAVHANATSVLLVGAASSRPEAADELRAVGLLLAHRLDRAVEVATTADDLPAAIAGKDAVATYLLAEGQFVDAVRAAAGHTPVSAPLGVHPAVVQLVWQRYDAARDTRVSASG